MIALGAFSIDDWGQLRAESRNQRISFGANNTVVHRLR
jgi:hypothetical protein